MAGIKDGLYFIAADKPLTQLLEPANSNAIISVTNDGSELIGNLNTPNSSVWKLEMVTQGGSRNNFFLITSGDSLSLVLNNKTGGVYLDNIDRSDDRQLWDLRLMGYDNYGTNAGLRVKIRNKYDPSIFLDIDTGSSIAAGKRYPTPSREWIFISLIASVGGSPSDGPDGSLDDFKENRDWLRDMLWYFTRRYGRANASVGFYPFADGHINYPNKWLLGSRFLKP